MAETAAEARTKPGTSGPDEKAVEDARLAAGTLLAWLSSEAFPADRELLVASARKRHAPAWLTDSLGGLPAGIVFQEQSSWPTSCGRNGGCASWTIDPPPDPPVAPHRVSAHHHGGD